MPRKPVRSRKTKKRVLTDAWRYFLESGDYCVKDKVSCFPGEQGDIFIMGNPARSGREKLKAVWLIHRDDILRDWKAKKKKGLPWAAKIFDEKDAK